MLAANSKTQFYRYKAALAGGQICSGTIEAPSSARATVLLGRRGMIVLQLDESHNRQFAQGRSRFFFSRVAKPKFRAQVYAQLALLLDAGCPLDRALQIMRLQQGHASRAQDLARIEAAVAGGETLSKAVREVWTEMGKVELAMIAAGERAASLPVVMSQLAASLDRRRELVQRIGSALIYPAFLLIMAPVILLAVTFVLVPNLAPLFQDQGEIPFALKTMTTVYWLLTEHFMIVAATAGLTSTLAISLFSVNGMRETFSRLITQVPVIARIAQSLTTVRICGTLSTLLGGGVPLQTALKVLHETAKSDDESRRIRRVIEHVSGGKRLSASLALESVLAPGAAELISIGEEANKIDTMLLHVVRHEESRAFATIDAAVTLLAPCTTLIIGLLVGGIILSVMRSVLAINQFAMQ